MKDTNTLQIKPGDSHKRPFESADALESPVYTPLKKSTGTSFARLRKQLIKKLESNDLETLEKEIKSFSEQLIIQFFETEYPAIFHWLLTISSNTSSFEFVLKMFPLDIFQEKFRENNFLFLTSFLNSRAGMDSLGLLSSEMRALDIERFKLLLKIDPEGIKSFMEKNKEARFMSPSTYQDYEAALVSYNPIKAAKLK